MWRTYLEVVQVGLHVLQQLQDAVLQSVKERLQSVKLFIHQLQDREQEPG